MNRALIGRSYPASTYEVKEEAMIRYALATNESNPRFLEPRVAGGMIAPPIFPRRVDWFRQNRAFDITRARNELNYEPAIGLDEGLRRTGAWYRAQGMLPKD